MDFLLRMIPPRFRLTQDERSGILNASAVLKMSQEVFIEMRDTIDEQAMEIERLSAILEELKNK